MFYKSTIPLFAVYMIYKSCAEIGVPLLPIPEEILKPFDVVMDHPQRVRPFVMIFIRDCIRK
jgi:hypothetical protein